jgi:hypothetical protein
VTSGLKSLTVLNKDTRPRVGLKERRIETSPLLATLGNSYSKYLIYLGVKYISCAPNTSNQKNVTFMCPCHLRHVSRGELFDACAVPERVLGL